MKKKNILIAFSIIVLLVVNYSSKAGDNTSQHLGIKLFPSKSISYTKGALLNLTNITIEKSEGDKLNVKFSEGLTTEKVFDKVAENIYTRKEPVSNEIWEGRYILIFTEEGRIYFANATKDSYDNFKYVIELGKDKKTVKSSDEASIKANTIKALSNVLKAQAQQYKGDKIVFSSSPITSPIPSGDGQHDFSIDKKIYGRFYLSKKVEDIFSHEWARSGLTTSWMTNVKIYFMDFVPTEENSKLYAYDIKSPDQKYIDFEVILNQNTCNNIPLFDRYRNLTGFTNYTFGIEVRDASGNVIATNYLSIDFSNTNIDDLIKDQSRKSEDIFRHENDMYGPDNCRAFPYFIFTSGKSKFTDPALSVDAIKKITLNSYKSISSITKIYIFETPKDWSIEKDSYGIIQRKTTHKKIVIVYKTTDNECMYGEMEIVRAYEGGGTYGAPYANIYMRTQIDCSTIK